MESDEKTTGPDYSDGGLVTTNAWGCGATLFVNGALTEDQTAKLRAAWKRHYSSPPTLGTSTTTLLQDSTVPIVRSLTAGTPSDDTEREMHE